MILYNDIINVEDISPFLEYTELKKRKIVPSTTFFTKVQKRGGTIPKNIDKSMYQDIILEESINYLKNGSQSYTGEFWEDFYNLLNNFKDDVTFPITHYKNINTCAHFVHDKTVFMICPTTWFNKCRIIYLFTCLSNFALLKTTDEPIESIGILLPCQNTYEVYNIKTWNTTRYIDLIDAESKLLLDARKIKESELSNYHKIRPKIGTHVSRSPQLACTVCDFKNIPIQIFLGSGQKSTHSFTKSDIEVSCTYCTTNNVSLYVHSPYVINLCRENYMNEDMKKQFTTAKSLGSKGIVFHIGVDKNNNRQKAIGIMMDNLIDICEEASENCRFILETSSGGSVLDDPKDLVQFYKDIPEKTRQKVGLCIDTCHVFAAGYDIVETLEYMLAEDVYISLAHFNDSIGHYNSKKDRHAKFSHGLIPLQKLCKFAEICDKNSIHMVRE